MSRLRLRSTLLRPSRPRLTRRRLTRPRLVASALSSVLALTVLGALPTTPSTTAPANAAADTTMLVGTYNIRSGVSIGTFHRAVEQFKERVDVAGLQEIGASAKNDLLKADQHWGYFRPPEIQQNPVIWRRSQFDFLGVARNESYYRIADARDIERTTGGMEHKRPTWATIVRLRHRGTGRAISLVNVHLVHGAMKGGRGHPDRPRRFALLKEQISGLVRVVRTERAAGYDVYAVGDYNVDFRTDYRVRHRKMPFRRFKRIGFRSMWQGYDTSRPGTHSRSYLDQVYNPARPSRRTVARDIDGSDHHPGIARYTLPVRSGYTPATGTLGFAATTDVDGWECDGIRQSQRSALRLRLEGNPNVGYAVVRSTGPAEPGVDFELDTTGLYDGDPSRSDVVLRILPNDRAEADTRFRLELVDEVNTTITRAVVQGDLLDDDRGDNKGFPDVCKQ